MERKRLMFRYSRDPAYRVVYANGAFGGVTPRGEIKFDLFVESPAAPDAVRVAITPDGLGPEESEVEPGSFVREAQVGVVMTGEQAKHLGHWLLGKVSELENRRARRGATGTEGPSAAGEQGGTGNGSDGPPSMDNEHPRRSSDSGPGV